MNNTQSSPKSFWLVLINALVLGWLGAHRFAVGKWKSALLQLCTFGGLGVWVLIDIVTLLRGKFTDAAGLPIPNPSKAPSWIVTVLLAVSLLVRLSHHGTTSSAAESNAPSTASVPLPTQTAETAKAGPSVSLPADEKGFLDAVTGFIPRYDAAPNELKKSAVRVSRKAKLQELMPTLEFKDWLGRLEEMTTTSKGNATLKISLPGGPVSIATHDTELGDLSDNTLIQINSELFNRKR